MGRQERERGGGGEGEKRSVDRERTTPSLVRVFPKVCSVLLLCLLNPIFPLEKSRSLDHTRLVIFLNKHELIPCKFEQVGAQHEAEDLAGTSSKGSSNGPAGEVHVYTWRDATLKELSDLVREVVPEARQSGVRLDFSLVYTDKSGRARSRRCGSIATSSSTRQQDASVTLQSCRWQPGDMLSVRCLECNMCEAAFLVSLKLKCTKFHIHGNAALVKQVAVHPPGA